MKAIFIKKDIIIKVKRLTQTGTYFATYILITGIKKKTYKPKKKWVKNIIRQFIGV